MLRAVGFALLGLGLGAVPLGAQGYRLRLDSRFQSVSYRGLQLDSVPLGSVVTGPTGGFRSPDGFAVQCNPGATHCFFFRPGAERHGAPLLTGADLTLWGFGLAGLSAQASARAGFDLGDSKAWPGSDPAVQLFEGYLEYAARRATARVGRQTAVNQLGYAGYDGGNLVLRDGRRGLEVSGYLGWGLGRASAVPVASPVLNPLDEYRPARRQLIVGGSFGWTGRWADARLDYQREVDRRSHYFVSERIALSGALRPATRWSFDGGAEYDLAQGFWGTADGTLRYASSASGISAGVRRYRPHFDLWTIWGAFSPVPYTAVTGNAWIRPWHGLELRGGAERYWFADAQVTSPLVDVESRGWRASGGLRYTPTLRWAFEAGYQADYGPGAASRGWDGSVAFAPSSRLALTASGATLSRPLEFRYSDADVKWLGLDAEFSPGERIRLQLGAARYWENRNRPDAAALDWNQTRITARVILLFGASADETPLPPATRRRRPSISP